jgi:hypothetical protein
VIRCVQDRIDTDLQMTIQPIPPEHSAGLTM